GSGAADSFSAMRLPSRWKATLCALARQTGPRGSAEVLAPAFLKCIIVGCPASKLREPEIKGWRQSLARGQGERRDEDSTQGDRRAGPAGDGGQRHRPDGVSAWRLERQGPGAEGRRT